MHVFMFGHGISEEFRPMITMLNGGEYDGALAKRSRLTVGARMQVDCEEKVMRFSTQSILRNSN